jgi:hypothetical protein
MADFVRIVLVIHEAAPMDVKARREDMDSSLASRAAITEYLRASSLRRRRGMAALYYIALLKIRKCGALHSPRRSASDSSNTSVRRSL